MRKMMAVATAMWAGMILMAGASSAQGDVIASNTAGIQTVGNSNAYFGQSFTTAAGPGFTGITFNFFSDDPVTPYAIGTGFLLSQAYTGRPADLNSSTAGYLGTAVASGGIYNFGNSVTLAGGTQYFFYENAAVPAATILFGGIYSGGQVYFASDPTLNFSARTTDLNFAVNGIAVPEPASLAMLGVGLAGLGIVARSRRVA